MSGSVHDPVSRTTYTFERDGENLIVHAELEAGGKLPPHLHPHQEERWSVVEGRVRFRLGKATRLIGPDDGEIVVRPNVVHGLKSVRGEGARLRCVAIPALGLQEFLEEAAAAARDGMFLPGGIPRGVRGARWAAGFLQRYGDETVFVWPPRVAQRLVIALFGRRG